MKKQLTSVLCALSLLTGMNSHAQDKKIIPCKTYDVMEEAFKNDPQARTNYLANQVLLKQAFEQEKLNQTHQGATSAVVYTIPVVVHILHTGGSENISDATVIAAIDQVNRDLARLGSDTGSIAQPFRKRYIASDIKLMLAKKDPNGNCTNGIVHRYDTRTTWDRTGNLTALYSGITWNPTRYLNIIIVKDIVAQSGQNGIVVGYTYKPGTWQTGSNLDAIVYNYGYLSGLQARSLTHELGHWLGLDHTFGNTNNPGVSCGDDGLLDTPPTMGYFSTCPSSMSGNNCSSTTTLYTAGQANVENIMDYSSCPKNLTSDQTAVIRGTLNSSVSGRNNVVSTTNHVTTGINNTTGCAPIADFLSVNGAYTVCAGGSISFKDISYNATISTYAWSADNGATFSNPNVANGNATFPNVGTCTVALTASNAQGSSVKTRTVYVLDGTAQMTGPAMESFEAGLPSYWSVINNNAGSGAWEATWDAAYDGGASFFLKGSTLGANQEDVLQTPIYDVAGTIDPGFEFAVAYAKATSTQNDVLKIQASLDCGGTFYDIISLSSNSLQASSGGVTAVSFTPTPEQWKVINISTLPKWNGLTNYSSVILRFTFIEGSTGFGNNIWLDAVNLTGQPNGLNKFTKSIRYGLYPNPTNGEATANFTLSDPATVTLMVTDLTGRTVSALQSYQLSSGEHNLKVNSTSELPAGVYLVNLTINGTRIVSKLVVE